MPGPETLIEIGKGAEKAIAAANKRADERLAAELRESKLEMEATRQTDWRKLIWLLVVGLLAIAGLAGTFWDDWVRREIRLDELEKSRHHQAAPAPAEEPPGFFGRVFGGD